MEYKSSYNPYEAVGDVKLRVSKSCFMSARQCLRRYWWNKIALPDVRMPETEFQIKGTIVHKGVEDLYNLESVSYTHLTLPTKA